MPDRADPSLTDTELLRHARQDPAAFGQFYDRYANAIHSFFVTELRDEEAALDLTAETFAQALAGLRRLRGQHASSGRAWIYSIARHLLSRHRERGRIETRARKRLGMPLSYSEDAAAVEERLSASARASSAVAGLPPEQGDAIRLRVVEELSYADVAARLDCTPGAARTRVSRGLRQLEDELRRDSL
jgi:RNA polymerase sigma-70 factor (ECF subfamily)